MHEINPYWANNLKRPYDVEFQRGQEKAKKNIAHILWGVAMTALTTSIATTYSDNPELVALGLGYTLITGGISIMFQKSSEDNQSRIKEQLGSLKLTPENSNLFPFSI